jgi:signal transduction histidine kinase
MPRDVEATVFRIVQEALTNVHRHANTKAATVRITADSNGIQFAIEDRGTGIPGFQSRDDPNVKLGVGIQGMRERVRYLNGAFDLQSSPGGTIVSAFLPRKSM